MDLNRGAITRGPAHGNLELARQIGEFRMKGGPAPHQFTPGARVFHLIRRNAGELVRGDVADAVAAGLDRVHIDFGQLGQDVRHLGQLRPVELDVLARREMGVALVVGAGDMGEPPQLPRRDQSVGDTDPQHGCQTLDIKPVLQTQRAELVFGEVSIQIARGLVAKLPHPLAQETTIPVIVEVHGDAARTGFGSEF